MCFYTYKFQNIYFTYSKCFYISSLHIVLLDNEITAYNVSDRGIQKGSDHRKIKCSEPVFHVTYLSASNIHM